MQSSAANPADVIKFIGQKISKKMWFCFFVGLGVGLVTHLFMITNKIPNWDDLTVIPTMGLGPYAGRWLGDTVQHIFSQWSAPGVNGVWAVIMMALSACLAADILDLQSMTGVFFCAVLFQVFPVMASNMTFMFMTETFAAACLFMCLAVELMLRFRLGWIPAIVLQMWSMACYQAYFPLGVALTVLALLRMSVTGEIRRDPLAERFSAWWEQERRKARRAQMIIGSANHSMQGNSSTKDSVKSGSAARRKRQDSFVGKMIRRCLSSVLTLAAGMAAYLISFRVTTGDLEGFEEVSYRGIENIGNESLTSYVHAVLRAYHRVLEFFITNPPSYMQGDIAGYNRFAAILIVLLWIAVLLLYRLWKKPGRCLLYCILTALLPLSMGLVYVMSPETQDASTNMIVAYLVFHLILIVLAELTVAKLSQKTGVAAVAISLVCTVNLAFTSYAYYKVDNTAYYRSYIANERVKAFYNRILVKLEEQDGFTYDSRVLISGDWWPEPNTLSAYDMDGSLYTDLDGLANEHGLMTTGVRQQYVRLFLGINSPVVGDEEREAIESSDEYKAMPVYPADGCVRKFGDIYVVKLAESAS